MNSGFSILLCNSVLKMLLLLLFFLRTSCSVSKHKIFSLSVRMLCSLQGGLPFDEMLSFMTIVSLKLIVFLSPSQLSFLPAVPPCCWGCGMSLCGRKALTLLSSVFAVCALGLLGIAVSTDYWLYLEEGVILPLNQTTEIRMSLHSGLWRVCFLAGELSESPI